MSLKTVQLVVRIFAVCAFVGVLVPLLLMTFTIPSDDWCKVNTRAVVCVNLPGMKDALHRDQLQFAGVVVICAVLLAISENAKPRTRGH